MSGPRPSHVTDAVVVDMLQSTWLREIAGWLESIEDDANRIMWTDDERERQGAHERIEDAVESARRLLSEIRVNVALAEDGREPTPEEVEAARRTLRDEGLVPS